MKEGGMKENSRIVQSLSYLSPYSSLTKTWLINMSVAAMAVRLFQDKNWRVVDGSALLVIAYTIIFIENRFLK